jgi:hypothetical protein
MGVIMPWGMGARVLQAFFDNVNDSVRVKAASFTTSQPPAE